MTVAELGEHALLARTLSRLPRPTATVFVGPGDDAAVLAPGRNERLVVTTDAVVEGVHFSRAFSSPADIGHKALAVNLSDLAAMAATPRWALLSLVLPGSWLVADVEELVDGLAALAGRHGVAVVGGNITRTDGPIGRGCNGRRRSRTEALVDAWRRASGSRDLVERRDWRRGRGIGHAPRRESEGAGIGDQGPGDFRSGCIARHRRPEPRVRLGIAIGRARAATSRDGFERRAGRRVRQVAAASGVGVRIDGDALPIDRARVSGGRARGRSGERGGERRRRLRAAVRRAGRRAAARCGRSRGTSRIRG